MNMTPEQCRAGRALVGMSQAELAKRSRRGLSTVQDFELERRTTVSADAITDMQAVLIKSGVEFIHQTKQKGPGVRLTQPVVRQVTMDI